MNTVELNAESVGASEPAPGDLYQDDGGEIWLVCSPGNSGNSNSSVLVLQSLQGGQRFPNCALSVEQDERFRKLPSGSVVTITVD